MRSGVTAAGVLMMIIGVALMVFIPTEEETPFIEIGEVGLLLHQVVGGVMGFLGFLVFIAGLAASPPQEQKVSVQQPTQPEKEVPEKVFAICPECKARIPSNTKFCPECGADLTPGKAKPSGLKRPK